MSKDLSGGEQRGHWDEAEAIVDSHADDINKPEFYI